MPLEQLAYFAEIIGVGAVVVSLIYVGRQLRQNTEMLRVGAAGSWVGLTERLTSEITTSREVAEYWLKAGSSSAFDDLDEVDQQRAIMFEWRAITNWNQWFELRKQGLMPDAQWNEMIWLIRNLGHRRAVQEAWRAFEGGYDQAFRDFVSRHLEEGSRTPVSGHEGDRTTPAGLGDSE